MSWTLTTNSYPSPKTNGHSLPKGWQWVKLGDVCKQDRQIVEPKSSLASRLLYLSLEHIESNSGRILREPTEPIQDEGRSTSFHFDNRHVLYGKLRPYLNKVALPDFEGRCTTELIPILPTDIDREFLAWVLRRKETVDVAMQEKTGSRMPRANMDNLLALEIPLPPLDEQQRIASRLNEQLAAVESARKAAEEQLHAAYQLPSMYLREVFESEDARKWDVKKVLELCRRIDYGYTASANFAIKEPKFLRITDIQGGKVNWAQVPGCKINSNEEQNNMLSDGDIVFARTGATTGKSFLIRKPPRAVFASYLIRLQHNDEVTADYLYAFFQSDSYWQQIRENARGAAQPNVNATLLGQITLPVAPVRDQGRIISTINDKLAEISKMTYAIESQLAEINRLPASLLREAFAGRE